MRVTARVGDDPGLANRVIAGLVNMAVNPQAGLAFCDELAQIGYKGGIQTVANETGCNRSRTGRVMGHDDPLFALMRHYLVLQPFHGLLVPKKGVGGFQYSAVSFETCCQ